ncbi:hypothetical protein ENBRE01_2774 [Enteropsectra breve]|nr:hypothetical protein ENBRE01_2774 [Enteropsectra breve]
MRIVSFNVNGLRAFSGKIDVPFNDFIRDILGADILCVQEIKGSEASLASFKALKDYSSFCSFHKTKGRHGVMTFVRKNNYCSGAEEIDQGRILKTNHGNFSLYNCYMPYCDEAAEADKSKIMHHYTLLLDSLEASNEKIILTGDMNACYNMADHYQYMSEYEALVIVKKWEEKHKYTLPNCSDENKMQESENIQKYKEKNKVSEDEELTDNNNDIEAPLSEIEFNSDDFSSEAQENYTHKRLKIESILTEEIINKTDGILNSAAIAIEKGSAAQDSSVQNLKMKRLEASGYGFLQPEAMEMGKLIRPRQNPRELPYVYFNVEVLEKDFFAVEQRAWIKALSEKYNDTFRMFNHKTREYSCWNTVLKNREVNLGTRIDYIFSSKELECESSGIWQQVRGSDHAPVFADFKIAVFEGASNKVLRKNNLLEFFK